MLTNEELAGLIDGLAGLPYGGEAVDQRRHALQCAARAVAAGSDDELVLAAALHDIGRAEEVRAEFPGLPHEQAGEAFARDRVGEGVGWLIGQHVPAKRYLVAVDETYFGQLSPASVRSLERQGGPMNPAEVEEFRSHPRAEDAATLRRWDEAAKDAEDPGLPMADLLRIFDRYREAAVRA
jgi:predicted HD phosphohydrolase